MTDIEQIRRALQMIASGTEDIEPPYRAMPPEYYRRIAADALPLLDRVAARVGEGWCFDMEKAPKTDGAEVDLWTERGRVPDCHWHEGEWLHWAYQSVDDEPRWERITPIAWRPLPKPPETDDEQ